MTTTTKSTAAPDLIGADLQAVHAKAEALLAERERVADALAGQKRQAEAEREAAEEARIEAERVASEIDLAAADAALGAASADTAGLERRLAAARRREEQAMAAAEKADAAARGLARKREQIGRELAALHGDHAVGMRAAAEAGRAALREEALAVVETLRAFVAKGLVLQDLMGVERLKLDEIRLPDPAWNAERPLVFNGWLAGVELRKLTHPAATALAAQLEPYVAAGKEIRKAWEAEKPKAPPLPTPFVGTRRLA